MSLTITYDIEFVMIAFTVVFYTGIFIAVFSTELYKESAVRGFTAFVYVALLIAFPIGEIIAYVSGDNAILQVQSFSIILTMMSIRAGFGLGSYFSEQNIIRQYRNNYPKEQIAKMIDEECENFFCPRVSSKRSIISAGYLLYLGLVGFIINMFITWHLGGFLQICWCWKLLSYLPLLVFFPCVVSGCAYKNSLPNSVSESIFKAIAEKHGFAIKSESESE